MAEGRTVDQTQNSVSDDVEILILDEFRTQWGEVELTGPDELKIRKVAEECAAKIAELIHAIAEKQSP